MAEDETFNIPRMMRDDTKPTTDSRVEATKEIVEIEIDKLKSHPENDAIYGTDEDVSDLIPIIEVQGILDPLVVTDNNVIISGHRRWKAAKHLGYSTVPCIVRHYDGSEEELAELLSLNVNRIKTNEQRTREGIRMVETLSSDAILRKMAALKQNQSVVVESSTTGGETNDGEESKVDKGKTRDKVAEAVGLASGKTFDRSKAVVDKIDSLKNEGKNEEASLFISVLNRKPTAAYDLLEVDIASLSDDVKDKLRTGKAAPRSFKKKKDAPEPLKKQSARQEKLKEDIKTTNSGISKLKKSVATMKNINDEPDIRKSLETTLKACNDLTKTLESVLKAE